MYRKRLGRHLADYQKNIPPHAKAAKQYLAENPHFAFQRGQIIEYVYTTQGVEYYMGKHNYDYLVYVNKQLLPIVRVIVNDLVCNNPFQPNGQIILI